MEDDATKWGAFARLVRGSVTAAEVTDRDPSNHPATIVAPYMWDGFARTRGRVTLTLTDGVPECLRYSETPNVCHSPNRKIVAAYLDGAYSQR